MVIWTIGYFPFTMGGRVNRPIKCDVPVEGPFDIGAGYQAYVATSPSGKTFVAEGITGAIVGSTLESVRDDVRVAVVGVMEEQVEAARQQVSGARMLTPEKFWHMLRAN